MSGPGEATRRDDACAADTYDLGIICGEGQAVGKDDVCARTLGSGDSQRLCLAGGQRSRSWRNRYRNNRWLRSSLIRATEITSGQ